MSGSAQEKLWETVYASGSVPQMMNRHHDKLIIEKYVQIFLQLSPSWIVSWQVLNWE